MKYIDSPKSRKSNSSIDHNTLDNVDLASGGITYGHINDQVQTITGVKTFVDLPISSGEILTNYQLINKKFVDDSINNIDLSDYFNKVSDDSDDIIDTATNRFTNDIDILRLADTSGTNTGDVSVLDSIEINFTLTNQQITAEINSGSIDESKLDASINSSLDLADSSIQIETDPVFVASEAYNISSGDIENLGNLSGVNTGDQSFILASDDFEDQGVSVNNVLHGNGDGNPSWSQIVEADILLDNNATNNVSTTKHGFAPILPNNANVFLDGQGNYSSPPSGGAVNSYKLQSFTNQTSVNVIHNFGTYPVIQVLDNTNAMMIPLSIVNNSLNDFTITFSTITTGNIIASVGSPQAMALISISSDYTALLTDRIINVTTSGITVTLPTAIGNTGREYIIDNLAPADINVTGILSQTIQGENIQVIPPDSAMNIYSTGSLWRIY